MLFDEICDYLMPNFQEGFLASTQKEIVGEKEILPYYYKIRIKLGFDKAWSTGKGFPFNSFWWS